MSSPVIETVTSRHESKAFQTNFQRKKTLYITTIRADPLEKSKFVSSSPSDQKDGDRQRGGV